MSADNAYTLWIAQYINKNAINRAAQVIQQTGRELPCTVVEVAGAFVTVKFECNQTIYDPDDYTQTQVITLPQITIPRAEKYFWSPIQPGDVGITLSADVFLGGITEEGGGVADVAVNPGNLTALVFVPVSPLSAPTPPDANSAWVWGPNGVVLSDPSGAISIALDLATNTITFKAGGKTMTFGASGLTDSTGVVLDSHVHGGVTTGAGESTGPKAP